MKILVLGGTGMAGHMIATYLNESGHDITVFSRKETKLFNCIVGDITNFINLENIIINNEFDAVINAIGVLNSDAEFDKPLAIQLNSYLPHFLAKITRNIKTKIIHLSTDCVFSGKTGNYTENSLKDGETFYDRTKALGELDNGKDLTFRNSLIGPDLNPKGIGLLNWFLKQNSHIVGYSKVYWSGVTTLVLSKAIEKALENNISGIYHLVNNQTISKYNLLNLFNHICKQDSIEIEEDLEIKIDKSMINTRIDFNFLVPNYEIMIQELYEWMIEHKNLYPHYFREKPNEKT